MFWSVSLVWAVILVKCGSVSTYMAIIPGNVPGREYYSSSSTRPTIKADGQSKESEETDTGETFERSLRSDCGRLLRLYNRLHSESGAYALLAEGQIDGHVLDDCAKFLLTTNRAFPLSSITRDYDSPYWKRALRSASCPLTGLGRGLRPWTPSSGTAIDLFPYV